ncbi:MAG: flippase-like domain-containing protein [Gammaproteobacteria bacterium]|nr:flippase-like domain-containing protein [Gammaproteobacteria bacterium]NNM01349.1 flippase-like domain-containing protein [Gammaproteobacteria bacterium]
MKAHLIKLLFVGVGVALLIAVCREADLPLIWQNVSGIGLSGLALVMLLYTVTFGADVAAWLLAFETMPSGLRWFGRLYLIRVIGEAYNNVTPTASMGGEPLKVWLLRHNHGIAMRESGAALVLGKTTGIAALGLFAMAGFALVMHSEVLAVKYKAMSAAALAVIALFTVVFFLMQHLKLSTFVARRVGSSRLGRDLSRFIAIAEDIDSRFLRFYTEHRRRLLGSLACSVVNWLLGMVEIWLVMALLGVPVSWSDAWIIESLTQMIRVIVFFIPSAIGAQEGTLVLATTALLGNPAAGLSTALVRRARELIWIGLGLALAALHHVSPRTAAADAES